MEIINENYILLSFEFDGNKKFSVNDFRSVLMGIDEEIKIIREKKKNLQIHNVPSEINKLFIERVKKVHKDNLDNKVKYLYPIDFSLVKRVIQTFKVGERTRFVNKPVGAMVLFKYMGPLIYISDFLILLKQEINSWKDNENDIFNKTVNQNIILGSETKYLEEIVSQNYFLLSFAFNSEKADPNDFRRALLGLTRITKGKEIPFNPNVPEIINMSFLKRIEKEYDEKLDSNIRYIYPIDFAIIKRPVSYDTKSGKRKSNFAAGVFLLYKYMGPLTYIKEFKEILQLTFKKLRSEEKKEIQFKNSYFNKANDPVIILGAELRYYNVF